MSLIDCHIHVLPPKRLLSGMRWIKEFAPDLPIPNDITAEELVAYISRQRADYFFNLVYPIFPGETEGLNAWQYNFCQQVKQAIPFGSLHPTDEDKVAIVDKAILEYGFLGIKFHPLYQRFHICDRHMFPVYQRLTELGRPLFLHTGGFVASPTCDYQALKELLENFPRLTIIGAHLLYPQYDQAFELLEQFENLIMDTTLIFANYTVVMNGQTFPWRYDRSLEKLEKYSDRLMNGSDYPLTLCLPEVNYSNLKSLGLKQKAVEDMTYRTAYSLVSRFAPELLSRKEVPSG